MNEIQIDLVKNTWSGLVPKADTVAELFYANLFELDERYKSLFKGDMVDQGKKLTTMLNTAVRSLDKLDDILPAVQALGERHTSYGVVAKDYGAVGSALLKTLEQGLGSEFTAETKEAWTLAYTALADVMIEAASTTEEAC